MASLGVISMLTLGLVGCGGGGGGTVAIDTSSPTITGTVPGTLIEAFCDNGSYYSVNSTQDGTARHPFSLQLPADLGCRLVMTTNEGTAQEVVSPIGFMDADNVLNTRLTLRNNTVIDLGYVPLPMSHAEAASSDINGDGILDAPFILDNYHANGARNPLMQIDADNDGIMDYDDSDHGGQQYASNTVDPQDTDGDGVPNRYDEDFTPAANDSDEDGLPDHMDANPHNTMGDNGHIEGDDDDDGYHDDDHDRNGFPDDEQNQTAVSSADQGAILFGTSCASCHDADGADMNNISAAAISSAMASVSAMSGIAAQLTQEDYLNLSAYLSRAGHDTNWSDEDVHGAYAEDNGVTVCAACHGGAQLDGNGSIPSCYSCHDDKWSSSNGGGTPNPAVNTPPVANAGINQSVTTGDTVTLSGSASSDADNDSLSYNWTLAGTPANSSATLSNPSVVSPSFFADLAGTYTLNLIVNDGQINSASDTMTVTASVVPPDNVAPNGSVLYSSKCSGCHGGNMGNRSAAQITSAINANKGGMGFLSSLTPAEINAIATFLGP